MGHIFTRRLLSKWAAGVFTCELTTINARIDSDDFSRTSFLRLVRLIVDSVSDTDIWRSVFDLFSPDTGEATTVPPVLQPRSPYQLILHIAVRERTDRRAAGINTSYVSDHKSRACALGRNHLSWDKTASVESQSLSRMNGKSMLQLARLTPSEGEGLPVEGKHIR